MNKNKKLKNENENSSSSEEENKNIDQLEFNHLKSMINDKSFIFNDYNKFFCFFKEKLINKISEINNYAIELIKNEKYKESISILQKAENILEVNFIKIK